MCECVRIFVPLETCKGICIIIIITSLYYCFNRTCTSSRRDFPYCVIITRRLHCAGVETKFAGSSCNDLVTSETVGTTIMSGHFDKRIRFWDTRTETPHTEIEVQGRVTSLDLSRGKAIIIYIDVYISAYLLYA